jgi:hypothetical protein
MWFMNTTTVPKSDQRLWGIYHTDREYARTLGDPLRTTIEAPTKAAAEEAVAKLGFSDPWAHPVAPEVARLTERILKRQPGYRQAGSHKPSRGIQI